MTMMRMMRMTTMTIRMIRTTTRMTKTTMTETMDLSINYEDNNNDADMTRMMMATAMRDDHSDDVGMNK